MARPKNSPAVAPEQRINTLRAVMSGPSSADLRRLDRLLEKRPNDVDALLVRAFHAWSRRGDARRAERDLTVALKLRPGDVSALANLAEIQRRTGRSAAAVETATACLEAAPEHLGALNTLVRADPRAVSDARLTQLRALAEAATADAERSALWWLVGAALEAQGTYAAAFEAFAESNARNPDRYRPEAFEARRARHRRWFTAARLEAAADWGVRGARPVFVLGPPRSGSTLLEQMLLGDPRFSSAGESLAMERCVIAAARAGGAAPEEWGAAEAQRFGASYVSRVAEGVVMRPGSKRLIDKMTHNFLHIGYILLTLPDAVVLHTVRHPLDTLASCWRQAFEPGNGFANSFEGLAHYFQIYLDFVRLWRAEAPGRVIDVVYEDLVRAPESEGRQVLEAAGGTWSAACLPGAAGETSRGRLIRTSSAGQADRPIHDRSIGGWRRYEAEFAPLVAALGGMAAVEEMDRELRGG